MNAGSGLREMKFAVRERGFRTQSVVVVTTLRDATTVSYPCSQSKDA